MLFASLLSILAVLKKGCPLYRSKPDPTFRCNIWSIIISFIHPIGWSNYFFIAVLIEPGRPPGKGTIGYDKMTTGLHKLQVIAKLKALHIVLYYLTRVLKPEVFFTPCRIIWENKKMWLVHHLCHLLSGFVKVLQVSGIQCGCCEKIRTPYVQAYWIGFFNFCQNFIYIPMLL